MRCLPVDLSFGVNLVLVSNVTFLPSLMPGFSPLLGKGESAELLALRIPYSLS